MGIQQQQQQQVYTDRKCFAKFAQLEYGPFCVYILTLGHLVQTNSELFFPDFSCNIIWQF